LWTGQFAGNEEQLIAELLQGEVLPGFIQTVSLKRGHQIICQADDLQVQRVGGERRGWNLAQCKVFTKFANPWFHPGTSIVKMPDPGWSQRQVGDPGTIDVAAHGEQGGLGFLLLNESSRHHETTGLWPTMGAVLELGHLPLAINRFIRDAGQESLERWGQTSDHRILCGPLFQGD